MIGKTLEQKFNWWANVRIIDRQVYTGDLTRIEIEVGYFSDEALRLIRD